MKNRMVLLYSIVAGIAGMFLTGLYVYSIEQGVNNASRGGNAGDGITVVMATKDIPGDSIIRKDMLTVKRIKETAVMPMALNCIDEVIGRVATEEIVEASQVTAYQVREKRSNLASNIEGKGLRAISLPVIGVNGLSGLLEPGNRVDIIGTLKNDTKSYSSEMISRTILQNVLVLAVGQVTSGQAEHYNSATVAVTPDESELLALAVNSGAVITLVLRAAGDNEIIETKVKGHQELLKLKKQVKKNNSKSVEIIRRTERSIEKLR